MAMPLRRASGGLARFHAVHPFTANAPQCLQRKSLPRAVVPAFNVRLAEVPVQVRLCLTYAPVASVVEVSGSSSLVAVVKIAHHPVTRFVDQPLASGRRNIVAKARQGVGFR